MTREEMILKIDKIDKALEQYDGVFDLVTHQALRAVLEIHKPNSYGKCYCTGGEYDGTSLNNYPCETIEAIEKELK